MAIRPYLSIIILAVIALGLTTFVFASFQTEQPDGITRNPFFNSTQAYVLPLAEPSYFPILDSNSDISGIGAKSAAVYDIRSGRFLYEKNSRQRLPVASLTKIITAVVVLEKFNTRDTVAVSAAAVRVDGEKQDLYEGELLKIEDLLKMMLVDSSNDAAYALKDYASQKGINLVEAMNQKISTLGLNDTNFLDPAGLNDEGYSSAQDMVRISRYAMKHDMIWEFLRQKESSVQSLDGKIMHALKNTNILLGNLPNIIGGKTGNTDNALGCLVLLVSIPEKNDTLISVVLGSKDRFGETEKLINWVKSSYRWE
ncbi:MAG: hypothetical protein UW43_C0002G0057 [Candidatus Yanofskybacteria bacterium GW2011_GWA1_44_21]|uniref:Peptidase S11 D-alanyl-D-alanine carboxypeptidase A N-terminal domain-containing protein n=2 Tax=Parcubacteria group TaxID=1794811 RepID=A0A1F8H270_9BACT|nr:MAG: hypothetical protein UU38_C0004G0033 [Candidatus Wolfebacteria bacterium GW2011_GWB1_41_12]KKT28923.1 MAG: hypothetical protein UW14_C0001G0034 [Candidatus Yanofskybacteria bacterium GW2011_GWA2_44_10]KKT50773.1 MAG: hypothetical protein UW43_C0002G0057 [Candidatus Yanofskybacteria bacterium GW2011_GWA1_44_21]OGN02879.1 MAG: hypothetical protein A2657_02680 [Candidatus Yanofskybacteria bacterium RIFCSPHIGHO2_01_FULL_44_110b]OGN14152.1 MAG: hypothetical protein A3C01_00970 [Candidatus Ya